MQIHAISMALAQPLPYVPSRPVVGVGRVHSIANATMERASLQLSFLGVGIVGYTMSRER